LVCALFALEVRFSLFEESADAFLRVLGVEELSEFFPFDLQVHFGGDERADVAELGDRRDGKRRSLDDLVGQLERGVYDVPFG